MKKCLCTAVILVAIVSALFASVLLEDFRSIRSFEYKITSPEGVFYYGARVEKKGNVNELTTFARRTLDATEEIKMDEIFSTSFGNWFILFLNPIFNAALESVDLQNPMTLSFFGMQLKYEGTETVGRWTGKKYTLYGSGEPMMTWVIDEKIKMSIKTVLHDEGLTLELVNFEM